jgi:predicted membrane protein
MHGIQSCVSAIFIAIVVTTIVIFGSTIFAVLGTIVGIIVLVCLITSVIFESLQNKGSQKPSIDS